MPLYSVHSGTPDLLYIFPESTADGGTAIADRTVNMPSDLTDPQAIAYLMANLRLLTMTILKT